MATRNRLRQSPASRHGRVDLSLGEKSLTNAVQLRQGLEQENQMMKKHLQPLATSETSPFPRHYWILTQCGGLYHPRKKARHHLSKTAPRNSHRQLGSRIPDPHDGDQTREKSRTRAKTRSLQQRNTDGFIAMLGSNEGAQVLHAFLARYVENRMGSRRAR